jgi:2-dehydro-3-deoxygalactonokinase
VSGNSITALLALDWGTTSARAYRVASDGGVLDERSAALGIQHVRDGAFVQALASLLGDWRELTVPRLACGMIGSRQGWIEAPYCPCPVALANLARTIVQTPGGELHIVGGISCRDDADVPDVIRGEETQIVGLAAMADGSLLVIQPGTHSKWTVVVPDRNGAPEIVAFSTYMTGEMFAVLREHSILGRMMTERSTLDTAAFLRGARRGSALSAPGELLHAIFGARTLPLFDELDPSSTADYLSGMLIGAEVAAGRQWAARHRAALDGAWLAGTSVLCERYRIVLELCGMSARVVPSDVAARGLWQLALQAGLVTRSL